MQTSRLLRTQKSIISPLDAREDDLVLHHEIGDILLLDEIATRAQGSVQLGYNQNTGQLLAIKEIRRANEYALEKAAHEYLAAHDLTHLAMKLVHSDDYN